MVTWSRSAWKSDETHGLARALSFNVATLALAAAAWMAIEEYMYVVSHITRAAASQGTLAIDPSSSRRLTIPSILNIVTFEPQYIQPSPDNGSRGQPPIDQSERVKHE